MKVNKQIVPLVLGVVLLVLCVCTLGIRFINYINKPCQAHKTLTAQIAEIQRSLKRTRDKVRENKGVLVSHDTHLTDAGYPSCYRRVVVDDAVYYEIP